MKKIFNLSIAFFILITAHAQKSPVFVTDGAAIHGYDAVAYFTQAKAIKGDSSISYNWNNANWYFVSRENKELFKSAPEKYAPQYGGYCAYGLSAGHKAPTDPQAWMVVDGKLYLNYSKGVQQVWIKKQQEFIDKANTNWPTLKDKE
ncbi:MAG: YHS domain-containing (seleno)protein [Chitinophagaceae bacterium]